MSDEVFAIINEKFHIASNEDTRLVRVRKKDVTLIRLSITLYL